MLKYLEFKNNIYDDFKKVFPNVNYDEKFLFVGNNFNNASIPIKPIFKEYQDSENYDGTIKSYIQITNNILNQYKFKINYNNVFPFLKHESFGKGETNFTFYRKPLFEDIHKLYVSDEGDIFRFILETDEFDRNKLEEAANSNLNKITNALFRFEDALDIYSLRFQTDYAASLIINHSFLKQVYKKVGHDYLFTIPSSTCLIIARYNFAYLDIIKSLILIDNDPNVISDSIYRCKNGVYSKVS